MDYIITILPHLFKGAVVTLELFCITLILSLPLGILLALARISKFKLLSGVVGCYIWLMRGTPLLLQMLFIAYGLPNLPYIGVTLDRFPVAIVAFALNYAAYYAEIFRGGILSINRGQYESAKVLGMNYVQTMRRIVLPQMVKKVIPPVGNEVITLIKDTSLIYILTLNDILRVAKNMVSSSGGDNTSFLVAAIFYLVMTIIFTKLFQMMEQHYARYDD